MVNLRPSCVTSGKETGYLLYRRLVGPQGQSGWEQKIFPLLGFNPLNPELNPICCLLALLGANHFLHVSRIKVKSLTLRVHPFLMFLDHTRRRSTVGRTPLDE